LIGSVLFLCGYASQQARIQPAAEGLVGVEWGVTAFFLPIWIVVIAAIFFLIRKMRVIYRKYEIHCLNCGKDLYARSTAVLKTGHCPYCDKWIIEDRSLVNKIDPAAILENGIAKKYLVLYRAAVASYISILLFAPMYLSALIAGHQSYWMRTAMVWARKFGAERGRERVFLFIVFWCVIEIVVTQVIVHYRKKAPTWLPQMFAGIAMDWGINDPNAGETPATRVKWSWVAGVVWIIWGISLFVLAAMKLMIEGLFPR